jgi:hypothetical protein
MCPFDSHLLLCYHRATVKRKVFLSMITLPTPQQRMRASAQVERGVFALAPRLDGSWRGFYFPYYFTGQRSALHARTDPAP